MFLLSESVLYVLRADNSSSEARRARRATPRGRRRENELTHASFDVVGWASLSRLSGVSSINRTASLENDPDDPQSDAAGFTSAMQIDVAPSRRKGDGEWPWTRRHVFFVQTYTSRAGLLRELKKAHRAVARSGEPLTLSVSVDDALYEASAKADGGGAAAAAASTWTPPVLTADTFSDKEVDADHKNFGRPPGRSPAWLSGARVFDTGHTRARACPRRVPSFGWRPRVWRPRGGRAGRLWWWWGPGDLPRVRGWR